MHPIAYALLCLAVPIAWGLVVVWLSNRIERMVTKRSKSDEQFPPTEYHI